MQPKKKNPKKPVPNLKFAVVFGFFGLQAPPPPQFTAREKQNSTVPGTYVIERVLARGPLLSAHLKNQQQHFLTAVLPSWYHAPEKSVR